MVYGWMYGCIDGCEVYIICIVFMAQIKDEELLKSLALAIESRNVSQALRVHGELTRLGIKFNIRVLNYRIPKPQQNPSSSSTTTTNNSSPSIKLSKQKHHILTKIQPILSNIQKSYESYFNPSQISQMEVEPPQQKLGIRMINRKESDGRVKQQQQQQMEVENTQIEDLPIEVPPFRPVTGDLMAVLGSELVFIDRGCVKVQRPDELVAAIQRLLDSTDKY